MVVTQERRPATALLAYADQLLEAQERERQWLADQLHDDVQQLLGQAARLLSEVKVSGELSEWASGALAEVGHLVVSANDSLGALAQGLYPSILVDLGLPSALAGLAREFQLRTGIRAQVRTGGKLRRMRRERELACYRVAQEALRNVEQHARARRVEMRLRERSGRVTLLIADDGQGMPEHLEAGGAPPSFGLFEMELRAASGGGALRLRSRPGRGTVVRISVQAFD